MDKKIIMMRGLPASGKSKAAKDLVDNNPGEYKRVSMDDLRDMLDNGKWSKKNERFALEVRDAITDISLMYGYTPIVDATNLHPKHLAKMTEIADLNDAEIEIVDIDTDVETCIERDLKRLKSVGSTVINRMYRQYYAEEAPQHNPELPSAIIVDIDGTLAHMTDRGAYDWLKVGSDTVDKNIKELVEYYANTDKHIIILSGRDGICEPETRKWLEENNIAFDMLLMRKAGDNRKDCIVKRELYEANIKDKYNVQFILDDRDQVVNMWRNLGLTCYQVAPGDF